ncbi:TIGR03619 family F420-dependent LLM class oxidoreductase [Streptomyces griseorubiginosus]|uniref:TIGR03619 family F420-dependent LLM class oxidoreductase n=1 Tax=Streptomyces griseorubiginosus TaxID=67304 RepID=UPI0033ABD2D8
MTCGRGPGKGHEDEIDGVLETDRTAEELGFDHVIASSHLPAGAAGGVTPDPVVLLSAVAGATSRIGLVTSVLILPLYHPVVVAHRAATLDRLSGGRLTLGVGTGWDTAEFDAAGVPFAGRGRRADEQLEVVRALWRDEAEVRLGVRPRRPGGPPVWVGGHSDAALRRALRYGDAWHGFGTDAAELAEVRGRLAVLGEEAGRVPAIPLELTAGLALVPPGFEAAVRPPGRPLGGAEPSAERVREELGELAETGLTACSLWLPVATEALPDALGWVAQEVLSHFSKE